MPNTSIGLIEGTLSGVPTSGQSRLRSDGNEGALCIHQSSSIIGSLPSDCIMSYTGHLFEESYSSAEMRSVYSAASADWDIHISWSRFYHQLHVVPLARISLTLSHPFSQSFIASGRSSGLHPVSSHSCCMYVRAGRPAFARPYVGVHII